MPGLTAASEAIPEIQPTGSGLGLGYGLIIQPGVLRPGPHFRETKEAVSTRTKNETRVQILFRLEMAPDDCFEWLTRNSNRAHVSVRPGLG